MKLKHFYSECKKYAEANTPDVLETVLEAPVNLDIDDNSIKPLKRNMRPNPYAAAACLIVGLSSITVFLNIVMQNFSFDNNPPVTDNFQPPPPALPNQQDTITSNHAESKHENGELYFNQIEKAASAKIRLPEGAYRSEIKLEEYISYLGRDPRPAWMPEGMEQAERPVQIWYYQNGDIYDSSWTFHYSSDLESSEAKRIDIDVEKGGLPRTDNYILGEERVSEINDTKITLGHTLMEKNHKFDNELYYAEFINNEIGYRITAEGGITQEEFIKTLQSMIEK